VKYTVEVEGRTFAVEVRANGAGDELSVDGEPFRPARLAGCPAPLYSLEVGSERSAVRVEPDPAQPDAVRVHLPGRAGVRAVATDARAAIAAAGRTATRGRGPQLQRSPMPGVVVEVRVEPGQHVDAGAVLLVLEAMKMQNEIRAERPGQVAEVHVAVGEAIPGGAKLISFAPEAQEG